jgi:hypothetical protein
MVLARHALAHVVGGGTSTRKTQLGVDIAGWSFSLGFATGQSDHDACLDYVRSRGQREADCANIR